MKTRYEINIKMYAGEPLENLEDGDGICFWGCLFVFCIPSKKKGKYNQLQHMIRDYVYHRNKIFT